MSFLRPRALLCDVMGTVVDVDGTVRRETSAVLSRAGLPADDIAEVLTHSADLLGSSMNDVRTGARSWAGHRALRTSAITDSLERLGHHRLSSDQQAEIAHITDQLTPWPDSAAALDRLRRSFLVVALSNADTCELAAMSASAGLAWHGVVSAELIETFKPDPAVYQRALHLLDLPPGRALMVAAHPWDLRAAAEQGLTTAFINRPGTDQPDTDDEFDLNADNLADLADLADQLEN